MRFSFFSQRAFTLVEVLTVMLLLVAIASITVESTKDFVFQGRYDVTKDRYEKIKKAIIGDPNQVINGQLNIEGFVKDMGRLPDNIRELFQTGYCKHSVSNIPIPTKRRYAMCGKVDPQEVWQWVDNISCSDGTSTDKTACENNGQIWLVQYQDPTTKLYYGWHGSYLSTSNNVTDNNAFTDGWGNKDASSELDVYGKPLKYGWNFLNRNNDNSGSDTFLILNSFGKHGISGDGLDDYDKDYPATDNKVIVENDWKVDVNNKIQVNVLADFKPATALPCSLTTVTDGFVCKSAGWDWFGSYKCSIAPSTNTSKSLCESALGLWTWQPVPKDSCSNETSTNKTDCNTAGANWGECTKSTLSTVETSKYHCESNGGIWTNNSKNICLKITYRAIDTTTGLTYLKTETSTKIGTTPAHQSITEDGREHLISFPFFNDTITPNGTQDAGEENIRIPFGSVSVEVYTDCDNTNPTTKYNDTTPPTREEIKLTLYPNITLPTINW